MSYQARTNESSTNSQQPRLEIVKASYTEAAHAELFDTGNLTAQQLRILLVIRTYAGSKGECTASVEQIAAKLNLGVRTVKRHLAEILRQGRITAKRRRGTTLRTVVDSLDTYGIDHARHTRKMMKREVAPERLHSPTILTGRRPPIKPPAKPSAPKSSTTSTPNVVQLAVVPVPVPAPLPPTEFPRSPEGAALRAVYIDASTTTVRIRGIDPGTIPDWSPTEWRKAEQFYKSVNGDLGTVKSIITQAIAKIDVSDKTHIRIMWTEKHGAAVTGNRFPMDIGWYVASWPLIQRNLTTSSSRDTHMTIAHGFYSMTKPADCDECKTNGWEKTNGI